MGFFDRISGKGAPGAALIARRAGRQTMLARLRPGGNTEMIAVSTDHYHVIYGMRGPDRKVALVRDDSVGAWYDDIGGARFTADSQHVVYWGRKGNAYVFVFDGEESQPYVRPGPILCSEPGSQVAYSARMDQGWVCVLGGVASPVYDDVTDDDFLFSRDGRHLAYGAKRGERWLTILDGVEQQFEGLMSNGLAFSPDGNRFAYQCGDSRGVFVVLDGVKQAVYSGATKAPLTFSPDGRHLAYVAKRDDRYTVVIDGQENGNYRAVSRIAFSPDSRRTAFETITDFGRRGVVLEGQEIGAYDGIMQLTFSPDSQRFAYFTESKAGAVAFIDGQPSPLYAGVMWAPVFSPDSRHCAYAPRRGRQRFVVVDGVEGPPYDGIIELFPSLVWSMEIRVVIYGARQGKHQVMVAGNKRELYDRLISTIGVDSPTEFNYVALNGDAVYRVEENL